MRARGSEIVGWGIFVHPRGHRLYIGGVTRRQRAYGEVPHGNIYYSSNAALRALVALEERGVSA